MHLLGLRLKLGGVVQAEGSIFMNEQASAEVDRAGYGQFWVRNDAPNTPMFTDDDGVHFELNTGPAVGTVNDSTLRWSGSAWVEEDRIRITAAGDLYVYDSTTTDYARFFHDNVDFNTIFLNTTDWNIFDIPNIILNRRSNANSTLILGESTTTRGDSQDSRIDMYGEDTSTIRLGRITNSGVNFQFNCNSGLNVQWLGDGSWVHEFRDGAQIRIFDSTDVDHITIQHNGTDALIDVNNGSVLLSDVWNWQDNEITRAVFDDYAITSTSIGITANAATCTYSTSQSYEVDLENATGNVTITLSGNPPSGEYGEMIIKVQQDTTADRTITWAGGTFEWPNQTAPVMTTGSDSIDIYHFSTWDAGTTWYGSVLPDMG